MQPEPEDLKYLWDMLDAAKFVVRLTAARTLQEYEDSRELRYSVERAIEIIGEAARRVSAGSRKSHPEIQWNAIVATRHIIAHEYGDIQNDKIWRIATSHLPELVELLTPIIERNPPEDGTAG
ncbi:MAG: DUF86 domain-containing protein [Phycisphaeraceae bacterium]|nr:DUF86 domain-containing protein [Phycisphaeraceae bacterium]